MAIIAIGISLPIWLYLTALHPRLVLRANETSYRALSAACDQAVHITDEAAAFRKKMTSDQMSLLDKSLEIGRLPCRSYASLKEYLLSEGVSQHALSALHLSATLDQSYPDLAETTFDTDKLDAQLRVAITNFGLTPIPLKEYARTPKFRLGEKLFYDPLLSGLRNRSCATCHKVDFATTNGLDLEPRLHVESKRLPKAPARNVPDLWNRDHNDVSNMLWDGRLQATIAPHRSGYLVPEAITTGSFENLMAVQSVRPIIIPTEMLGESGPANGLAPDELVWQKPADVLARVAARLFAKDNSGAPREETYPELFLNSYGVKDAEHVSPAHLGNALAHYIEMEFQSRDTPWDNYLAGNLTALTEGQKRGALLFFGIGKCAVCHSGGLFSDFLFHSVGVPDARERKDLGRFYATGKPEDRYLFRTPPLRNVTLTAPYFHNGQAQTLIDAIQQHLNPHRYAREYADSGAHMMDREQIEAISPILATKRAVTDGQAELIGAFLKSLEDPRAQSFDPAHRSASSANPALE